MMAWQGRADHLAGERCGAPHYSRKRRSKKVGNHGEGTYEGLLLVESSDYTAFTYKKTLGP